MYTQEWQNYNHSTYFILRFLPIKLRDITYHGPVRAWVWEGGGDGAGADRGRWRCLSGPEGMTGVRASPSSIEPWKRGHRMTKWAGRRWKGQAVEQRSNRAQRQATVGVCTWLELALGLAANSGNFAGKLDQYKWVNPSLHLCRFCAQPWVISLHLSTNSDASKFGCSP